MQAIALLDTLDKDVNTFVMRVREWYSWHFPELVRIVPDNYTYTRLALAIQEKGSLSDERKEELAEITGALQGPGFRTRIGDNVVSSFRLQLRPGS
jgi:nucleolar protein 56